MDGDTNIHNLRNQAVDVTPVDTVPDTPIDAPKPDRDIFLPDGCPVIPLGVEGEMHHYLDQLKQHRALKAKDHSKLNLQSLFGRLAELVYDFWPRRTVDKNTGEWITTGWKAELCAEAFMSACAAKGVWSPQARMRGAGAWCGADGELILHVGDALLSIPTDPDLDQKMPWRELATGLVGDHVYPAAPPILRPHPEPQSSGPTGPAAKLLALLETWSWRQPEIDPYLLLGWIGSAMIGGALKWRPVTWVSGGSGSGKSSLESLIQWLFGENALLHTSDATSAAVRQVLGFSTLPVAIDEAEADEDNRRMNQLVKLARDAANGSLAIRGGQDHTASRFVLRCAVMFTSILIPPLIPQDRNRLAILNLDPLPQGVQPPAEITQRRMGELGRKLLRRLAQEWQYWPVALDCFRQAMARAGHTARGQDVYGTLLAVQHLLLIGGEPTAEDMAAWEEKLKAEILMADGTQLSDQESCLQRLLSTMVEAPHDRKRYTVAELCRQAKGLVAPGETQIDLAGVNKLLAPIGVKVEKTRIGAGNFSWWLAVANSHRGLDRIYDGSQWAGRPGAPGVWVQSLRRLPHLVPEKPVWIGSACRVTLLPLEQCIDCPDGSEWADAPA